MFFLIYFDAYYFKDLNNFLLFFLKYDYYIICENLLNIGRCKLVSAIIVFYN